MYYYSYYFEYKAVIMAISYKSVVPWGRSLDEYVQMFALTESELKRSILGCSDGPAAFNASMTKAGHSVVSADPVYALTKGQIEERIEETFETVLAEVTKDRELFVWDRISSPEEMGRIRMEAMELFLKDYEAGKEEGRYVESSLPELPFDDGRFSLALCSHFLFLYSANLDREFHLRAIDELCRVAGEIRIFPILDLNCSISPHLEPVIDHLKGQGYRTEIIKVDYEFQKGGDRLLKIWR